MMATASAARFLVQPAGEVTSGCVAAIQRPIFNRKLKRVLRSCFMTEDRSSQMRHRRAQSVGTLEVRAGRVVRSTKVRLISMASGIVPILDRTREMATMQYVPVRGGLLAMTWRR